MKSSINLLVSLLFIILLAAGCQKPVKVLVVTGGHSYDTTEFNDLFTSLEDITCNFVAHPDALEVLASKELQHTDVVVFYDFIPAMAMEDSSIFLRLAENGMPMLFLHHAICTFQRWEGYSELIGGKYVMPEYSTDSMSHSSWEDGLDLQINILDPSHPVTDGLSEFSIHDEAYYNMRVNEDVHPLLGTGCKDMPLVAWENKFLNSTSLYVMFGHAKYALENPSYQRLLHQSIQYLAHL